MHITIQLYCVLCVMGNYYNTVSTKGDGEGFSVRCHCDTSAWGNARMGILFAWEMRKAENGREKKTRQH